MNSSIIRIQEIIPRKSYIWYGFLGVNVLSFIIFSILFWFDLINIPFFLILFLIVVIVPILSLQVTLMIDRNYKRFTKSGNSILLTGDKIIFDFVPHKLERFLNEIDKINLKWDGYDEGPINHMIFSGGSFMKFKQGNKNFIEFIDKNEISKSIEFYCNNEHDSILLKNRLLYYQEQGVDLTVIIAGKTKKNN